MIDTPQKLAQARLALGMSPAQLGRALRLESGAVGADGRPRESSKLTQRVLDMERGERLITGPISVAVEALLTGWRPEDYVGP